MGTFNTKTTLMANPDLIPAIAERICSQFAAEGYEVKNENLLSGGADISISKGGMFKAALGMKTALKITLIPQGPGAIGFEAGIGIFGQQAVPTIIMLFFAWPVLLTQIWGLVQQSKLDDKALTIAQSVIAENAGHSTFGNFGPQTPPPAPGSKFCTQCGSSLSAGARFCSNCGSPLNS